jgi:secreted PhoX family phosphatase
MTTLSFDTTQPSQVKGLGGYTVDPIFTVGDKIGTYVPPGILDGIGAYELNSTTVRIYANHEIGTVSSTDLNVIGYKYKLSNGAELGGTRVSYFDVDKRTFQIVDSGLAYNKIINRAGNEVKSSTAYSSTNVNGLDVASGVIGGMTRFCSAALFEAAQFGNGVGLADRIFFTGEESDNGTEYALDTATNTLYAVPWFGRASWENVTELNTGRKDKVAFMIGDDTNQAPLYLYVGNKKGTSFLERNGLADGKLFVWVADDPASATDAIERDASTFKGNNASTNGKFVEIAYYDPTKANTTGYDFQGFASQVKQFELADAVQAFKFSRPEDVSTNPKDGTQVVLASTGVNGLPDVHGTTYRIDVDFSQLLSTTATVPTAEDTAPFLLPTGFTQTEIVDRTKANLDPQFAATFGNWDMVALDPTNRYIYIPAEVGEGAGLARYDIQTGDFVSALTGQVALPYTTNPVGWDKNNDDFGPFDPAVYTPHGTVITAEERTNGRLFEWLNPLMAAGDTANVVWRSNIPAVSHEGLKFDASGTLYFIDESNTGSIYKFVPKTAGDLSVGQSFVLKVTAFTGIASENWDSATNTGKTRTGAATWVAITDANGVKTTTANPFDFSSATTGGRAAADEVGGTPYGRPEDLEIIGDTLYVATTSENAVYGINLKTNEVKLFASRSTIDGGTALAAGINLNNPDNLASDAAGNLYIIEDNGPGDIWKASDSNKDGVAESITRWASLGVAGSEPTGLISTKNPNEFIVAIQHPTSGNDALWKITSAPEITAKIDILVDGNVAGATGLGLRSPDNLDWADDGKIYINEDRANSRALFEGSATPPQEASIFRIDPANANPSSTLTRVAQIDRTGLPATQTDASVGDTGNWETSGILDVSTLFGAKSGELFIFDVQAHSLRDGSIITATNLDGNGDGAKTRQENLVEGGQLSFLIAPTANLVQNTSLVAGGSASADTLIAGSTPGFDGVNDIVFAGGGDDKIESVGGPLASGNRIDAGSGKDTIDIANNDRVFGGEGNDILDASDASGYRASGGTGNDDFFLGSSGRALGGDGDDRFFVQSGGGNLLSGGAGADIFNIFSGDVLSAANIILDFQTGTDKIGIGGGITSIAGLTLTGSDIINKSTSATIATLTGIITSTLTASDFMF